MARYRGVLQGSVSRLAHAKTGMRTACGGWSIGASVTVDPTSSDFSKKKPTFSEQDELRVSLTRGSSSRGEIGLIATLVERAGQPSLLTFYNPGTGEQITTIDIDA